MNAPRRTRARSMLVALLWLALGIGVVRIALTIVLAWLDVTS